MTERSTTANKFELVVIAGKRAKQLLDGCTPRTTPTIGSEKFVRLALKEVREGKVARADS